MDEMEEVMKTSSLGEKTPCKMPNKSCVWRGRLQDQLPNIFTPSSLYGVSAQQGGTYVPMCVYTGRALDKQTATQERSKWPFRSQNPRRLVGWCGEIDAKGRLSVWMWLLLLLLLFYILAPGSS
ncbi:hypothetical protein BGZ63DRAFT_400500 [Mariannaea sp. PMI_226]|nr:hypothetical protein BGZ63DRAFT_400500 [Mariannaea sp. PMI_226]